MGFRTTPSCCCICIKYARSRMRIKLADWRTGPTTAGSAEDLEAETSVNGIKSKRQTQIVGLAQAIHRSKVQLQRLWKTGNRLQHVVIELHRSCHLRSKLSSCHEPHLQTRCFAAPFGQPLSSWAHFLWPASFSHQQIHRNASTTVDIIISCVLFLASGMDWNHDKLNPACAEQRYSGLGCRWSHTLVLGRSMASAIQLGSRSATFCMRLACLLTESQANNFKWYQAGSPIGWWPFVDLSTQSISSIAIATNMEYHGNLRSFSLSPADRGLRPLRGSWHCRSIEGLAKEFPIVENFYMEFLWISRKYCASSSVSSSRQLRNSSQDWPMGWHKAFDCSAWFTSLEGVVKRRCIGNEHYLHTVHIYTYICHMHCPQERTLASTASARISSQMWPLSFLGLHEVLHSVEDKNISNSFTCNLPTTAEVASEALGLLVQPSPDTWA